MTSQTSERKIRQAKRRAFLAAYAQVCSVTRAAEIAKIDRTLHYVWLKDPAYVASFEEAHVMACESLEAEASRRGKEGVMKPVYGAGKRVLDAVLDANGNVKLDRKGNPIFKPAFVVEYSDTLLIFRMKGEMPEKYRDRVSNDNRFVDSAGKDRPFLLSDADRLIAEADAADAAT